MKRIYEDIYIDKMVEKIVEYGQSADDIKDGQMLVDGTNYMFRPQIKRIFRHLLNENKVKWGK